MFGRNSNQFANLSRNYRWVIQAEKLINWKKIVRKTIQLDNLDRKNQFDITELENIAELLELEDQCTV